MLAIASAGLKTPEDIAVVGFDGTALAEMVSPPLSTIEQPSQDIGRTAVGLLLNKIDNPDAPAQRVMMDWHYISRLSA
jgi:DNA-binding LacI/PurR family transcriptional regulator